MYYTIIINGTVLGTVGHPNVKNMNLSLQIMEDGSVVFANAVCEEGKSLYLISWFEHPVLTTDIVEFKRSSQGVSSEPLKKYKMQKSGSP